MTARELITALERLIETNDLDDDILVMFAYDYGDRVNTVVAAPIEGIEDRHVVWSEYHNMDKVVETTDGDDWLDDDARQVIILDSGVL